MYNEERKISFINQYATNKKSKVYVTRFFEAIGHYESKWNCDIAEQATSVIESTLYTLLYSKKSTNAELNLTIVKEYVSWCEKNGYCTNKNIATMKVDIIENFKKKMVSSPLHLKTVMDKIDEDDIYRFDLPEKETIDIVYRVYLWMAFAGMYESDAIRVTSDCVDLINLKINFEGKSYELYKESRVDFEKACNLKYFRYEHKGYSESKMRKRADGNIIMRGFKNPDVNVKSIRPKVNKFLSPKDKDVMTEYDKKYFPKTKVSYSRVKESGIFYRAYERERAGLPVDFSDVVAMDMEQKEKESGVYKTDEARTYRVIANYNARLYRVDYERWKCAFAI